MTALKYMSRLLAMDRTVECCESCGFGVIAVYANPRAHKIVRCEATASNYRPSNEAIILRPPTRLSDMCNEANIQAVPAYWIKLQRKCNLVESISGRVSLSLIRLDTGRVCRSSNESSRSRTTSVVLSRRSRRVCPASAGLL